MDLISSVWKRFRQGCASSISPSCLSPPYCILSFFYFRRSWTAAWSLYPGGHGTLWSTKPVGTFPDICSAHPGAVPLIRVADYPGKAKPAKRDGWCTSLQLSFIEHSVTPSLSVRQLLYHWFTFILCLLFFLSFLFLSCFLRFFFLSVCLSFFLRLSRESGVLGSHLTSGTPFFCLYVTSQRWLLCCSVVAAERKKTSLPSSFSPTPAVYHRGRLTVNIIWRWLL